MTPDDLLELARSITSQANDNEQMEVACSHGRSTSVKVYQGEVESFTSAESLGIGIRVLVDGREGFASAGNLSPDVVERVLADARDNARFAEPDEHAGIAEPDGVEAQEVDLWRHGVDAMSSEDKIATALELERRVVAADDRIRGVRTATYGDGTGAFALASTAGIEAATRSSSAQVAVQPLADDGERTRTGFGWDGARQPQDLDMDYVVDRAVSRTVDLIGAVKPQSSTVSLVLDPNLTATAIGLIAGTLSGERVLKQRSPFAERVGERIAADAVTFLDDPTDLESLGSDSHDGEGLACRPVPLVTDGVLQGFFYDSYNGRKADKASTGSAMRGVRGLPGPGVHALHVAPGEGTMEELIAGVDHGVYVFSLDGLHSGVNAVSGDFSVGATGRMIRNGQLAEPINECTLASTLQRMLLDITRVGGEVTHLPNGASTPPLVIGEVALSGANA